LLFLGSINIGKDTNGTACHLPDDNSSVFSLVYLVGTALDTEL